MTTEVLEQAERLKIVLVLIEEMLGMMPTDPDVVRTFIASKHPEQEDPDEAESVTKTVEDEVEEAMTVFPRDDEGRPFLWDYQLKGWLKDSCGLLRRVPGSACKKIKAYRKVIDGLVFVHPRKVPLILPAGGEIGRCVRSVRISGRDGDRTVLLASETVPAGTKIEFEIELLDKSLDGMIQEILEYGMRHGLGQWRNSGKGTFRNESPDI